MKIYIVSPIASVKDHDTLQLLFKRLTDLFERLYIANIIKKYNNKYILDNVKITGVNGKDYDTSLDQYLHDNWRNSYLKNLPGTIGCALGHIKILKDIEKNNFQEDILVLEDDAMINPNFLKLVPNPFPEDYDIFVMHCYHQTNYDYQRVQWNNNIKKVNGETFGGAMGAYTYFVNGRNIKKILQHLLPLEWQIDFCLTGGNNPNINTYLLNPELKASADEPFSYRKLLNQKNIEYILKIKETSPYTIKNFEQLSIIVHSSMINDVERDNMFNFYLEDEDKNLILVNTFIDIDFPDIFTTSQSEFDIVKFKFKKNKIIEKNKKYKLYIIYTHPEGLHGRTLEERNYIYHTNNDPKFSMHNKKMSGVIINPNSSQDFVIDIDIMFAC